MSKKKKFKLKDIGLLNWYSSYSLYSLVGDSSTYLTPRMLVSSSILLFVEVELSSLFLEVFSQVYGLDLGLSNPTNDLMLQLGFFVLIFYVPFRLLSGNFMSDDTFLEVCESKPKGKVLFSSFYFSEVMSRLFGGGFSSHSQGIVFSVDALNFSRLSKSVSLRVLSYLTDCIGYNILVRLNMVVCLGVYFFALLFKHPNILGIGLPLCELVLYVLYLVLYSSVRVYYVKDINAFYYTFRFLGS